VDPSLVKAVIKVGDGRGFIIEHHEQIGSFRGERGFLDYRLVITAAHCLPHFPACHRASYLEERTYERLLGPLAGPKPDVWAECLFADPIADIAVLGSPDGQELFDQAEAYNALVDGSRALRIGKGRRHGEAYLLTLDAQWMNCLMECSGRSVLIKNGSLIKAGMSGSPILGSRSAAIGLLCVGGSGGIGWPNPSLVDNLPCWLTQGALLGHTQTRTTERYAHLADGALRAATDQFAAVYQKAKKAGSRNHKPRKRL